MYRKNFWCKFVIMDDFFYILFRKMILKGSNALIVKYEEDRHRHAGPSPSTGYKYVDNGFFFFFRSCCQDQKHGCQVSIGFCFLIIFFPNLYFFFFFNAVRRALVNNTSVS